MKWIAISGSWRTRSREVEIKVRQGCAEVILRGDGIVVGGALGVDFWATDEALKLNPIADRIRIFLPTSLHFYFNHNRRRAEEGLFSKEDGEALINQLVKIYEISQSSIIEGEDIPGNVYVEKWQYYKRNGLIINKADELIAFPVDLGEGTGIGTKDAIEKAKDKNIPIKVFSFKDGQISDLRDS